MVMDIMGKSRKRDGSAGYLGEEACSLLSMRFRSRIAV